MLQFSPPVLLITSALLHAGWNTATKVAKDKDIFVMITLAVSALVVVIALAFQDSSYAIGGAAGFKFTFFAGLFEGGYLISLGKSFSRTSLARAYAIMRGGAMVVVWTASLCLGLETFSWLSLTGSFVVLLGIIVTGLEVTKPLRLFDRSILWSLAGAVFIGGYNLFYAESLRVGANPNSLYLTSLIFSFPFIVFVARKNLWARIRASVAGEKLNLFLSSLAVAFGFLIFLHGLSRSGPGYAITLRNTSIFFAIGFSFLIRDCMTRMQIIGACVIGLGAAVLGFGV